MDATATLAAAAADDAERLLDLRGLKCPMPALQTRKAMRRLAAGQALRVLTTDPLAGIDIPHLVREDGHLLAEASQADGVAIFVIVKQGSVVRTFQARRPIATLLNYS